ncbi:hypothetical protein CERSUDRAFT_113306 [Gelatoporia subvermispora B]|uniref:EH domain-containing protein n=1 Tax=Ceriporiopsis subvermispora (strain B) TaxID=914234 RepID=M2R0W1_CERS8|nr:hypothetical protein CERSUDRAFT_113306 [Gelatoporia subvermispora B]
MAPSALQARINAFEALSTPSISAKNPQYSASRSPPNILERPISPTLTSFSPITPSKPISRSPSSSPPNLGGKTSLIDLRDWVVDDGPLPYVPRQKNVAGIRAANAVNVSRSVSDSMLKPSTSVSTPLINLESPPNSRAPPLPPRKPSYSSLKSVSASNSSSSSLARSLNHPPVSLPPPLPRKQDSLTVDHTYPPWAKLGIAIPPRPRSDNQGHVPTSSISSFQSVSLSSDGGTDPRTPGGLSVTTEFSKDREDNSIPESPVNIREADLASLDESYENVSLPSAVSPTVSFATQNWEAYRKRGEPPKLPQRPKAARSVPNSPSLNAVKSPPNPPKLTLKPPPPPPPPLRSRPPSTRGSQVSLTPVPIVPSAPSSDRSSIISTSTATSSRTSLSATGSRSTPQSQPPKPALRPGQLARPAPIPPAARQRYEKLFSVNVLAQRRTAAVQGRAKSPPPGRKRQAAGWRGLSVDLITNPPDIPSTDRIDEEVGSDDRLEGRTVRRIWEMSKLQAAQLKAIWSECDPSGSGTLDRDGFVKGMWRIDEELRRAQLNRQMSAARFRQPSRMQSKFILR